MRSLILLLGYVCLAAAAPPQVLKVEPPNWWPGHSINPVRLLVHGSGFQGARVDAAGSGLEVGLTQVNARGTYLLVDIGIPPAISPGRIAMKVVTAEGSATIPFEVSSPLPRGGRFQGFSPDDVVYLVMPDRFANGDASNDDPEVSKGLLDRSKPRYYHGGDFQGILGRLPYLKSLGVTALWLTPWYDNVNHLNRKEMYDGQPITDYHGYGAVDFYGVEEHFGTMDKLRELVEAAHKLGIKIIQDQVANHSGPYHPWVEDSPTPSWYNGTAANHLANTWQTWTLADPYSPEQMRKETLEGWFINILPDLNQHDPETARYIVQNTLWWSGMTGLDGIRQDTWLYVPRSFWRDWMAAIKREYPNMRIVGEVFDGDPALVAFFAGGRPQYDGIDTGVDSLFDFPTFFQLRQAFAQGKSIRAVANMISHDRLYPDPNRLVTFLGLHDVGRFMSEPAATVDGLKLAWTFLMTARGIPMIYYGDEIGMKGGADPDNRHDFPGGWPGDPRNAFEASGRTPDEQAVFQHLQRLTAVRAENQCLRRGRMENLFVSEQQWAYTRAGDRDTAVVLLNNDVSPTQVTFGVPLPDGLELRDALGSGTVARVGGGRIAIHVPARSGIVLIPKTD
jgi:glycosidase